MITIEEIQQERARQNEKHPVNPKSLTFVKGDNLHIVDVYRQTNDAMEKDGTHTYEGIILEEVYEALTAETREERHAEIIQAIALLYRLDEDEAV